MTADDDRPAPDVYELQITEGEEGSGKRGLRWLALIVTNVIGMGEGPTSTGGRRIKIVKTSSGEVMLSFIEEMGDLSPSSSIQIQADMDSMTASAFAKRWWEY